MYFTFQKDHFTNPYPLFHVYLGLWMLVFHLPSLLGIKLGMLVLAGMIGVWYFRILGLFCEKWKWFGFVLLFAMLAGTAYMRLSFARPHVISLLVLLLGIDAILRRRWRLLGVFCWIYVYSYSACFLLPVLAILAGTLFSLKEKKLIWQPVLFSIAGMSLGLILNPSFPYNLNFLYVLTFKMGIQHTPFAGRELISLPGWQLFTAHWFVFVMTFLSSLIALMNARSYSQNCVFLFIVSMFFFVLTLHSSRFIEYLPVMAGLSVSSIALETLKNDRSLENFFKRYLAFPCLIIFSCVAFFNISNGYKKAHPVIPMPELSEVMTFLEREANEGDIVYSEDWELFSPMFYLNDKVYYILGLDPETMKVAHPGLYMLWFGINKGKIGENVLPALRAIETRTHDPGIRTLRTEIERGLLPNRLPDVIKRAFNAKWIILSHGHQGEVFDLRPLLAHYPNDFIPAAGNRFFSLYRIR